MPASTGSNPDDSDIELVATVKAAHLRFREVPSVEVSFAMTLREGWSQVEPTVGNADSPQNGAGLLGKGFFQESLVQRSVARSPGVIW